MADKKKDLRAAPEGDLRQKLKELRAELSKEMAKKAIGGAPTKTGRIRQLKRSIARLLTISKERKVEVL